MSKMDELQNELERLNNSIKIWQEKLENIKQMLDTLYESRRRHLDDLTAERLKTIKITKLTLEEMALAAAGLKIPAIRALRIRSALGLKDAKDIIEAWMEAHPECRVEIPRHEAQTNG